MENRGGDQGGSLTGNHGGTSETGMVIRAYNDHCSAPSSEPLVWIDPPSLLRGWSRHCYGIIAQGIFGEARMRI